jgi:hypothetical protein
MEVDLYNQLVEIKQMLAELYKEQQEIKKYLFEEEEPEPEPEPEPKKPVLKKLGR